MCIIAEKVQVAEKDIVVWKVFVDGRTPYRSCGGCATCHGFAGATIADITQEEASGFDTGFGYSAFSTKKTAREYLEHLYILGDYTAIKMKIPKGSRYAVGEIEAGCGGGSGLPAVRCEELKEVKP